MPTRTSSKSSKATTDETTYGEREDGMLSGNVTGDPELRFTPSGRAVSNLSIAVNERVKNEETGQWEDTEPEFHRVTVWGDQAERVTECFRKGDRVVAVGFFQDRNWTDKEGERRTTTEFTAREIGPSLLFRDADIKRPTRSKK
jgi:single-strand DNA-binding protein